MHELWYIEFKGRGDVSHVLDRDFTGRNVLTKDSYEGEMK